MYHENFDHFVYNTNEIETVFCLVCNIECVKENMGSANIFYCPNSSKSWHLNTLKLVLDYYQTNSKRLRALIKEDIQDELENGFKNQAFVWRDHTLKIKKRKAQKC